ncbi:MAG: RecX family transcriptional regulator, partial [Marinilabiliales bacterium]
MYKKKAITEKNAIIKAQNLCAEREKCESDIRKKLYDWKLPVKNHDTVIDRLIQDKFIDEKRFAISFAKDKFRYNKWGKIKIEFALKQKQINGAVIKIALDEIDESEYDTLLEN